MSAITYRPPLWSQMTAYAAIDDRRLINATFVPGVVDSFDLRVVPRQEGANLSVDVSPGTGVIRGTDQADQGSYVCALRERVNVPLFSAPSAGNHRMDSVFARVSEPVGSPATWDVHYLAGGQVATSNPDPQPPVTPASCLRLADILVASGTSAINMGQIRDRRRRARSNVAQLHLVQTWDLEFNAQHGQQVIAGGLSAGEEEPKFVTINLPDPMPDNIIGITANASRRVTVRINPNNQLSPAPLIIGAGLRGSSFKLEAGGSFVVLQGDGFNWYTTSGQQDSGWVDIPRSSGIGTWGAGADPIQCRRIGETVYLRGLWTNPWNDLYSGSYGNNTQGNYIATLDPFFRPPRGRIVPGWIQGTQNSNTGTRTGYYIRPNGQIVVVGSTNLSAIFVPYDNWGSLEGILFHAVVG